MIQIAIETGLRWGELIALRPRHLDFLRRTLTVEETIVEVPLRAAPSGERMIFKPYPKDNEPRTLGLRPALLEELAAHIQSSDIGRDDLLFTTRSAWLRAGRVRACRRSGDRGSRDGGQAQHLSRHERSEQPGSWGERTHVSKVTRPCGCCQETAVQHPGDDVRGMTVFDRYGRRLGEVEDLVVDEQERRARLLVISSGGILGLFESRRLVPVETIARVDDAVHVDRDHTTLRNLPNDSELGDRPDNDPERTHAAGYAAIYSHYGIAPFWSPDHLVSYFHRRSAWSDHPRPSRGQATAAQQVHGIGRTDGFA